MSSLALPSFTKLPKEILISILGHVKTDCNASLQQFILCCNEWRDAALPLLYGDVRLTTSNLDAFCKTFNVMHSSLVRSLAFMIDPVQPAKDAASPHFYNCIEDSEYMKYHGSRESGALWQLLSLSREKIATMASLITFSVTVPTISIAIGCRIPRPLISDIIRVLSRTCVNLEIDTRGKDHSEPGSARLCEALREVQPRLRHFRLRLSTFCPAIFGEGFAPSETADHFFDFKPIAAPLLETLIINCIPGTIFGSQAHICDTFQENTVGSYPIDLPEAWSAIVDALGLVSKARKMPVARTIRVLHAVAHYNVDPSVYPSLNRCDVLEDLTWALPFRNITGFPMDGFLIRTPEGEEYLPYPWVIETIAEGELWNETVKGMRFPTALLTAASSNHIPQNQPALGTEALKTAHPRKGSMLWLNEKSTGARLSDAECRYGQHDVNSVIEKTPAGWMRVHGGQLFKD